MLDVVIIGGGVVGCAIARELSKYDLNIAVLEKACDICNGQSKANTAIVHGGYDAKPGTLKAKFNVLGNKMFKSLAKELDVPFKQNGSLVIAFSEKDREKLEELKARGIKNGVEGLKIIEHDEIKKLEPNVSDKACLALYVPNAGIVCPYELTFAFAENACENGVEFFRNSEVIDIKKNKDYFEIITENKIFKTKAVVNAAGVYSDFINNLVSKNKFNIIPRRGQYYLVDKAFDGYFNSAIFQLPTKMGKGVLVAPTVDGTILIGPTAEDIKDKSDTTTTSQGLENVLDLAKLTWENIPNRAFITNFSGVRSHPDTNDFIIGEASDTPLFFNAAGIESPGLTSSPAIACYLADEISKKLNAKPNKNFNPIRKSIPKFREMTNKQKREAIAANEDYGKIVCRCETITEAEIRQAIRRPVGARTIDGIKLRTRAGMGRCQSGFCLPRVLEILAEELNIKQTDVTKFGGKSNIVEDYIFAKEGEIDA